MSEGVVAKPNFTLSRSCSVSILPEIQSANAPMTMLFKIGAKTVASVLTCN